jgi:hypothetical protein
MLSNKSRISSVFGFDGLCTTVFAVSIKTVSPEERNVSSFSFGVSTASCVRFDISAFIGNFFKHKLLWCFLRLSTIYTLPVTSKEVLVQLEIQKGTGVKWSVRKLRHLYKGYVLAREAAESQTKDRNNEVKSPIVHAFSNTRYRQPLIKPYTHSFVRFTFI